MRILLYSVIFLMINGTIVLGLDEASTRPAGSSVSMLDDVGGGSGARNCLDGKSLAEKRDEEIQKNIRQFQAVAWLYEHYEVYPGYVGSKYEDREFYEEKADRYFSHGCLDDEY